MPLPLLSLAALAVEAAPTIARWFGGAEAEDTVKRVSDVAQGIFGTAEPDAIAAAIAKDPSAAAQFKIALANIGAEKERQEHEFRLAALRDANDARAQTVELAKAGSAIAWGAPVVSVLVTAGYFITLFIILTKPFQIDPNMRDVILVLLGALQLAFGQVTNYWLGSSAGSASKDKELRAVRQGA